MIQMTAGVPHTTRPPPLNSYVLPEEQTASLKSKVQGAQGCCSLNNQIPAPPRCAFRVRKHRKQQKVQIWYVMYNFIILLLHLLNENLD